MYFGAVRHNLTVYLVLLADDRVSIPSCILYSIKKILKLKEDLVFSLTVFFSATSAVTFLPSGSRHAGVVNENNGEERQDHDVMDIDYTN